MILKRIPYFNLRKIMNSGQVFRMYEPEPGRFIVFSADRRLELYQNGENIEFYCAQKEFNEYWEDYFDLKEDYGSLVERARKQNRESSSRGTEFLMRACEYGADIRVLKQDVWEMMISFIISQQKQIPSIRKCIEALCERFGKKHEGDVSKPGQDAWYGFPVAGAIASAGPDGLKGLSLGYRERYIYETAVKFLTDEVPEEELRQLSPQDAKKYLISFTGIGDKVADCISLFGIGYRDSFPIDVHIKDILYREFVSDEKKEEIEAALRIRLNTDDIPRKKILESLSYREYMQVIDHYFAPFAGVKGIIQQWIFAYEISR